MFVLALPSARKVLPWSPAPSISSLRSLVKYLLLCEAHPDHPLSHCSPTPFCPLLFSIALVTNHLTYVLKYVSPLVFVFPSKRKSVQEGRDFFQSLPGIPFISIKTKSKHQNQKPLLSTFLMPGMAVPRPCRDATCQPGPGPGPC